MNLVETFETKDSMGKAMVYRAENEYQIQYYDGNGYLAYTDTYSMDEYTQSTVLEIADNWSNGVQTLHE